MSRSIAATAVGLLALAGVWLAGPGAAQRAAVPDAVLAGDYRAALAAQDLSWSAPPKDVWLSSLGDQGAVLDRPLAVGDVITIAGKGGQPAVIEVTGLEQVDGSGIGLSGVRLQLVTGRAVVRAGEAERGAQIQFLFSAAPDVPATPIPSQSRPGRVL